MKKIDFHVHVKDDIPLEETVAHFTDMCARHGYEGVNILAFTYDFPDCNTLCLKLAKMIPNSHAFGCILPDGDYARQAKELMERGFDGIKLIRAGKPNRYKSFPYLYDDPVFEELFALAEKEQYPLIMHNNDPAYSWDVENASERAKQMGWVYDETFPTHERYFEAIENVLYRHPRLKIALSHMGFYSENIDKAFELMELYPNLYMDMTPALNVYKELSAVGDKAKEFFEKYSHRCFFGTDAQNGLVGKARDYNDLKNAVAQHFYGGVGYKEISTPLHPEPIGVIGLALDEKALQNIYYNTAMSFISKEYKK